MLTTSIATHYTNINRDLAELLGATTKKTTKENIKFSFMFFSDVRKDINDAHKYNFMRDITLFADREEFTAIYLPERHFHESGSIYANSAVIAAYLIPQTKKIRFRTAGVSLPLHHPAEIVEWWAMNDILSNGRIDLGFGSGWNKKDFVFAPHNYENRKQLCTHMISIIQKLWNGQTVLFPGPNNEQIPITVYPRPVQSKLNVWLLVTQNDDGFLHAGLKGYHIFTMLYGNNLETMRKKILLYREGRRKAGLNPAQGIVTLMLHTFILKERHQVHTIVEKPFKAYIKNSMDAHLQAAIDQNGGIPLDTVEKDKIMEYAYQRYFKTSAIFGTIDDGQKIVEQAIAAGVDEIACLVDFGVDYSLVMESLQFLKTLTTLYK